MTPKTFIDRPILSGVISVFIVVLGLIGLLHLPIEQFPEIAPPTVSVRANYTGANAETVQKSVIIPLEESLNGVENMMYMTSSATNTGSGSISIFFKQGTDADMAMVNVQNRVASTQGQLPADVTRSGVTVRKRQTSNIKSLSLYSPTDAYDTDFLTNYMKINIEPRLSRVPGVGEVNIWGASYSMRIWLDPLRMASYGLMPSDIDNVLSEQNIEAPTGTLGADSENTFQYVLKYRGRYEEERDYENMVIKSLPDGSVLRLKDVAKVELGIQNYTIQNSTNGSSIYEDVKLNYHDRLVITHIYLGCPMMMVVPKWFCWEINCYLERHLLIWNVARKYMKQAVLNGAKPEFVNRKAVDRKLDSSHT